MCGILGAVTDTFFEASAWQCFIRSLNSIKYRGPDDWGWVLIAPQEKRLSKEKQFFWAGKSDEYPEQVQNAKIFLGHRRLSILDLSEAGHQPMCSKDELCWVTYNGEVYNYLEIREELAHLGHTFYTQTDTEVILAAYQQWGEECFNRFNGMWGMAIADLKRRILLLSRDRVGVKPLYYSQIGETFFFASEMKALLIATGQERLAQDFIVRDFLVHGLPPIGDQTFFQGIKQVTAGTIMCIPLEKPWEPPRIKRWWSITPLYIKKNDAIDAWRETLTDAVKIRLRSDVPVGSCLSGGIDSSAIVGIMATLLGKEGHKVHTITSCYNDKLFDERFYAEAVVRHIGASATWVYPDSDSKIKDDLYTLAFVQEQPFPTLSIYSQYCVMRAAKQAGIKVLLDGQGGDELSLGYDVCQAIKIATMLRSGKMLASFREIIFLNKNNAGLNIGRLLPLVCYFGMPRLRLWRNRRRATGFVRSELLALNSGSSLLMRPIKNLDQARKMWIEENPLPILLHYEDRNSMAHSIETRLPFLDYRMINLAFGLAENIINGQGWTKLISRRGMVGLVPNEVIWRRDKKGFPAPTSRFIRNLYPTLKEMFATGMRSKRFLNSEKIISALSVSEPPEWLWRAVSLELWMRVMDVN